MNVNQDFLGHGRCVLLGAVLLVLAGCSAVPLAALWSLRQLDFWTLDATQLHALLLLPPGVSVQPEALRVTVKATRGGGSAEAAEEPLVLRPRAAASPTAEQRRREQALPGSHWVALTFDEAELRRFDALRARLQAWKLADGQATERSFSVAMAAELCATPGGAAPGALAVSAWLRWKPGQDALLVLDGAGLKDLGHPGEVQLPACS